MLNLSHGLSAFSLSLSLSLLSHFDSHCSALGCTFRAMKYTSTYLPTYLSLSARKMRDRAGIVSLRARRIQLADKFATKGTTNPRFQYWFSLKATRTSTRTAKGQELYKEEKARCDRLFNSPIFYMRRRLNGKPGKKYGSRNAEYC